MSSLWTPSGEHDPSADTRSDRIATPGPGPGPAAPGGEPSQAEIEAEIRRTREELSSIPVVDLVANHAVGLWQLAVLHLTPDPDASGTSEPRLDEAGLAIDALAALVEGLGDRLRPHDDALRDALTQLRLAFVEVSRGGAIQVDTAVDD